MPDMILLEAEENMDKAITSLQREFATVRTGRANPAMLDVIMVEYYGVPTPVRQVGAITVPEGNQIYIKPYDKSILKEIEKAINASNLGLTPQNDGQGIRLVIPPMTEERRKMLVKEVAKMEENAKVMVRNCRRDANEALKKLELPEDTEKGYLEDVQKLTDKKIAEVEAVTAEKEKDLMTI
ncbi:MAG: ribosome recycling factor [Acholeplasmatales bacterium]|nr:ribosome recycling factor [Acholeplasmatales bacterium]